LACDGVVVDLGARNFFYFLMLAYYDAKESSLPEGAIAGLAMEETVLPDIIASFIEDKGDSEVFS